MLEHTSAYLQKKIAFFDKLLINILANYEKTNVSLRCQLQRHFYLCAWVDFPSHRQQKCTQSNLIFY